MSDNNTALRSAPREASWLRFAIRSAGILIGLIIGGFLLLSAVYCLPTDGMSNNVERSAAFFRSSGKAAHYVGNRDGVQDNITESLMLLTAVTSSDEPCFLQALQNQRYYVEGEEASFTFIKLFQNHAQITEKTNYARYWHGYLLWLKPLLMIMDFYYILYLNMVLQLALLVYLCYRYIHNGHTMYCAPLAALWLFLNPISLALSIQYVSVWLILLVQLIWLERNGDRHSIPRAIPQNVQCRQSRQLFLSFFLISGAATSYFDLLTYPLVTLGIPLAIVISYERPGLKRGFCDLIWFSILWGVGYGGMWIAKWIIASLLIHSNIIEDAVSKAAIHSSYYADNEVIPYSKVVLNTLMGLNPVFLIAFTVLCIKLIVSKVQTKRSVPVRDILTAGVPYAVVCAFPLLWFAVFPSHTYYHSIYSYRTLAISIYALLFYLILELGNSRRMKTLPDRP